MTQLSGCGLGFRRELIDEMRAYTKLPFDFFEVAPENWMQLGGRHKKNFRAFASEYPFICHGLSLSLGGPDPLNETFIKALKVFFDEYQITHYSEHLSYTSAEGQIYDLLPVPFTADMVSYIAARIKRTQELLERRIAIENVSYYLAPNTEMNEIDFLCAVLTEADCDLLLDVNNIYVNSINHQFDPLAFLHQIPGERIRYIHVAGHYTESPDLLIDTHGSAVCDPVWSLLAETYRLFGNRPTLLERDTNFPPLTTLLDELAIIKQLQVTQNLKEAVGEPS